jgi:hypothetical protein
MTYSGKYFMYIYTYLKIKSGYGNTNNVFHFSESLLVGREEGEREIRLLHFL